MMMAAMGAVGITIGGLWGYFMGVASGGGSDSGPVVLTDGPHTCGTDCKGCHAMDPRHGGKQGPYAGWSVTCSGTQNVDCDGCYGGPVPAAQTDPCPHGCICMVTCDHRRGYDTNQLVVGNDTLYAVHCNDGHWDGEDFCPPGASSCKDAYGHNLPADKPKLCIDHDDCASNPCGVGGRCHDDVQNYTCACHPGFSGRNCEIDEDECQNGAADGTVPPNPCSLQVRAHSLSSRVAAVSGVVRTQASCALPWEAPHKRKRQQNMRDSCPGLKTRCPPLLRL